MPTVGWIQETAEERFFERGDDAAPRLPETFPCPICGAEFETVLACSWHVNDRHPLERTLLFIRGLPAPATVVVRSPLRPHELSFENCHVIRARRNGASLGQVDPG